MTDQKVMDSICTEFPLKTGRKVSGEGFYSLIFYQL